MKLVIIESPYAGNVALNLAYARACLADSLSRGEAPFASHLLYTQPNVLNDRIPAERERGIAAGFAWGERADLIAFYTDLGLSRGMQAAQVQWHTIPGMAIEYRTLGVDVCEKLRRQHNMTLDK